MESYITAEISASAVAANVAYVRSLLGGRAKLCAVLKADGLGLGMELVWKTIAPRADMLAVATPGEAAQLRGLGYAGPLLLLLSPGAQGRPREQAEALEELCRARVTFILSSEDEVAPLSSAAGKTGAIADVHVKVDTGMGRAGAGPRAAERLVERVRSAAGLRCAGLCTHFATADDVDQAHAREQLRLFRAAADAIPRRDELVLHAANSAATLSMPESHLDMVRCGVALTGCHLSYRTLDERPPLRPAMRVWAPLMQVKPLPAGAAVGYGLTRTLGRPTITGLVPIGYGDGYMRCLSNRATMRVRGRDVPVLGRVSMDQTIVDLTDVPGAKVGDAAEIVSADPAAACSLENLARLAETIPQELACRLACRVRRVLVP